MAKDDYTGTKGALKLKGAKDASIDKHKKKKKKQKPAETDDTSAAPAARQAESEGSAKDAGVEPQADEQRQRLEDLREEPRKTGAERRHEEMRRRRLQDRLAREGVKTHKERVEELNKYLSNLSEHHDMPRIGPG